MKRTLLLPLVALAACGPYKVIREAEPNPFAGENVLMMDSLLFGAAQVDGLPESAWIAGQNEVWKAEWPGDQGRAAKSFADQLRTRLGDRGMKITPQANPDGAKYLLKPSVTQLETGGWAPTILVVTVQLRDGTGAALEEISTRVKVKSNFDKFEDRLDRASVIAGDIVANWVLERSGK